MTQFGKLIDRSQTKAKQIIGFWFHGIENEKSVNGTLTPFWFNATQELNDVIKENFFAGQKIISCF